MNKEWFLPIISFKRETLDSSSLRISSSKSDWFSSKENKTAAS